MKRKILIVDDEKSFTQLVKLNLEESGQYQVFIENNATNCLDTALQQKPEVILLDVIMPEMEGPDVLNMIRCHKQTKNIPVIFLTATVRAEEVNAQQGVIGGHSFIAKPSSVEELIASIEIAILNFKLPGFLSI